MLKIGGTNSIGVINVTFDGINDNIGGINVSIRAINI